MGTFWDNPDGLRVQFGTRATENNIAGVKANPSGEHTVKLEIRGTALADTANPNAEERHVSIPTASIIKEARLHVHEAFTSAAAAVLDIGVYGVDTTADDDDDGIDAAIASGALTANAVIVCDGNKINSAMPVASGPSRIGVSYDTAAYTGGRATLVVTYIDQSV